MNPERWERLTELLARARELPETARPEFVRNACADDAELLAEAMQLLVQEQAAPDGFLTSPIDNPGAGDLANQTIGDFDLLEEVGAGATGVVYRAVQRSTNREVAVKVLRKHLRQHEQTRERFRREAKLLAELRHPNLIRVLVHDVDGDVPHYAMEYVQGDSLRTLLTGSGADGPSTGPSAAALLVVQLAEALQHCHEHGVIHRDVKPGNIVLDRMGNPRLVDFGIARRTDEDRLTATGEANGTVEYMSPEQARAAQAIDHRTDVYSLGIVLYELLTGRVPFQADTANEVLAKILNEVPTRVRMLAPDCPAAIALVCDQAMRKDPSDRYQTAREFAADLRRCLAGERPRARPVSWFRLVRQAAGRWRTTALVAGLLAAVATITILAVGSGADASGDSTQLTVRVAGGDAEVALEVASDSWGVPPTRLDLGATEDGTLEATVPAGPARVLVVAGDREHEFDRELHAGSDLVVACEPRPDSFEGMVLVAGGTYDVQLFGPAIGRTKAWTETLTASCDPFWIDVTTVTNREFVTFLLERGNPDDVEVFRPLPEGDPRLREDWLDLPATNVTWDQARAYAEWRGKRLPTLAELRAAQLGDGTGAWLEELPSPLPFVLGLGDAEDGPTGKKTTDAYLAHVQASRGTAMGPLGLHHPFGNVLEWTSDSLLVEQDGVRTRDESSRYLTGGSWFHARPKQPRELLELLSIAPRISRSQEWGFRCARSAR